MRTILILAVAALAACSPPAERPAQSPSAPQAATPATPVEFMAASGNIGCIYIPAGGTAVYQPAAPGAELSCDRIEPTYVRIVLPESGAARVVDTQERGCCSGEPLAAGQRWTQGPFSCDVSEAGVACTSQAGHGFTLSPNQTETR
jgi:hypothetical protein